MNRRRESVVAAILAVCVAVWAFGAAQAQTKSQGSKTGVGAKSGAKAKGGNKQGKNKQGARAIQQTQAVLGKPLTETQKTGVRAAALARQKAMKPINDKFDAAVAKSLGMSGAAWKVKMDAHKKKQNGKGAAK